LRQVYIGDKPSIYREAIAEGYLRLRRETIRRVVSGEIEKGDPLVLARVSGVMGAKATSQLVQLSHNLPLESVVLDAWVEEEKCRIGVRAIVKTHGKTGVEMEALTAVAVALINVWDAVKTYEKDEYGQYPHTAIEWIRVVSKEKVEE